ncbi:MgtC/SapB family protein [Puniceicoccales bacterium CK1056]|uniref:MgtC/SapB family protein n=1 Tax=Oceanipulchritudo coccoides TaxID=2706888 RepID=A0A6B2M1A1_9BACT|nr:MgtC/SapB family protein [Oceanipulchritudo coccoides]NDV62688.1 MgtC/SapB family protein [Oceanipulchritudo coccoides]
MEVEQFSLTFLHSLVVGVSVGALIGLIRQWSDTHIEEPVESSAGLRTFSLWSLVGFLSAYVHDVHAPFFFPVSFATFGIFLIAANTLDKGSHRGLGLTSYSAAILTFLVGALIFWQQLQAAMAIAVTIGILLASKPFVHRWTSNLTNEDILSLLQFLAVTGLILPLVPNQGFGPLDAFNPYKIWLMVVLISGLGFVGYVAVRLLGTRAGITVTGLAGGLASSTATTLALTRNSRDTPEIAHTLAFGIIIANTVMIGRVALIILALNQQLFWEILTPMTIMALPTTALLLWRTLPSRKRQEEVDLPELSNPLSMKLAIKFALLYGLIVFLIKAVSGWGEGSGFYPVAFISGLTDMDAIALTLTNEQSEGALTLVRAAKGILIGAIANTIFKTGFALWLGDKKLRKPLLTGMIPMILAGLIGLASIGLF